MLPAHCVRVTDVRVDRSMWPKLDATSCPLSTLTGPVTASDAPMPVTLRRASSASVRPSTIRASPIPTVAPEIVTSSRAVGTALLLQLAAVFHVPFAGPSQKTDAAWTAGAASSSMARRIVDGVMRAGTYYGHGAPAIEIVIGR